MFAVAIDTVVFGTSAAGHSNLFSHGLTGAMDANRCVSFCNVGARGEISEAAISKIDGSECLAILRFQVLQ